ncbi:uncharacterized protein LOC131143771 isoform X2 [Malania oleifera]|uniref:uncharacterized protein LOC131143771 isoform X2 n=1 Tax=Malania oleifera TaxID=397392 RepID=UPI0025ADC5E3|nr:uncharacterized protein LOC131143771 isoform X2 [Malania oleifera]
MSPCLSSLQPPIIGASFFPSNGMNTPSCLPHCQPCPFPLYPPVEPKPFRLRRPTITRALREWQEYEDAVKRKDLARALRFLISIQEEKEEVENDVPMKPSDDSSSPLPSSPSFSESAVSRFSELRSAGWERDWEVLDTCLNADDMKMVGCAYAILKAKGFLPNFGKFRHIVLEGLREVTPTVLKSSTGLEAYLMGCPIRGVILDPILAMQMGTQGQAGTQFWDEKLANELSEGQLSGTAFDRYSMVLFAGIAAEALVYGEAEGGENDENLFRSICVLLQPPLSVAQMSNQARWSVLQSYNLLKWHKHAHRAAVKALESGAGLSIVIRRIEAALLSDR